MLKPILLSLSFVVAMHSPTLAQFPKKNPRLPAIPTEQAKKVASELDGLWTYVKSDSVRPGAKDAAPVPTSRNWPPHAEQAAFIDGDHFYYALRNGSFSRPASPLAIKVDSTRSPATLDFKVGNATYLGIYKVEKDELTFATQFSSETRPETFSTTADGPGRAHHVRVYKRVKESAEDAAAKTVGPLDPKTQVLDGLWALEEAEDNYMSHEGYPFNGEEALFFENKTWCFAKKNGWQVTSPAYEIAVDPNAAPPTIDVKIGKVVMHAIYKVEGDLLTIASASANSNVDRPRFFSTRLTSGRASSVRRYRRVYPTDEILKLKQTGKLDRANQVLDGLWVVAEYKTNIPSVVPQFRLGATKLTRPARLAVHEAVFFEKGKWLTAKPNGTLQPKGEKYDFKVDASKPIPTLEMKVHANALHGIYKIEGDALYFATNLIGDELPKYFTTNLTAGPGRAQCAIVFTRPGVPPAVLGENPKPKSSPSVPSELNGYWMLEKVDDNPPPGIRGWEFREEAVYIENGKYQIADKVGRLTSGPSIAIKADATKSPKTFDYRMGPVTWRAIYKIEGDALTVATNFAANSRPESFSTTVDAGPGRAYHVRTYRLVKETSENLEQRALAPLDPRIQVLDGFWKFQEQDENGPRAGSTISQEMLLIEGGSGWFKHDNDRMSEKSLAIRSNPKAVPPTIDLTFGGQTLHGIYKIEADRLTIASRGFDDDRPSWFTTKLTAGIGRAHLMRVYVRVPASPEVVKLKEIVKVDPATQKLDGLWVVDERAHSGFGRQTAFSLGDAVYLEKGKWQSARKNGELTKDVDATFVSDPKAPIPTIDLKVNREETVRGIYRIDGDTLYFSANFGDDDRPRFLTSDLTAGAGRATISAVLKRAAK